MKKKIFNYDILVEIILFLYIISLYIFSYRQDYFIISNIFTIMLIFVIGFKILINKNKILINYIIFSQLVFVVFAILTYLYAENPNNVINDIQTLIPIWIVTFSLSNYVDNEKKLNRLVIYFILSGLIASLYIITESNFTQSQRLITVLGNVNTLGMMIGISFIFCINSYLITRNLTYILMNLPMIFSIFITGSRKSLLFIVFGMIMIFFLRNRKSIFGQIKFLVLSVLVIIVSSYLIFEIPFFYNHLGVRLEGLIPLITGEGVLEASAEIRSTMIEFGIEKLLEKPFLGYGADNFRHLFGVTTGQYLYSHNNIIELLVNFGLIGSLIYYIPQLYLMYRLLKNSKNEINSKYYYPLIVILIMFTVLGTSLVYYKDKHFNIILALSGIVSVMKNKKSDLKSKNKEVIEFVRNN